MLIFLNNSTTSDKPIIKSYQEYFNLKLLSFQCDYTFYNVNSHNNTFVLNEDGNEFTITIDHGNYNVNEIKTLLKTVPGRRTATCEVEL